MSVDVEFKLTPVGQKMKKTASEMGKRACYVGFPESVGTHKVKGNGGDEITVAQVAAQNEFGTSTIPARPFMRNTFTDNEEQIGAMLKKCATETLSGKSSEEECLKKIGVVTVGLMKDEIVSGSFAPNSPITIAKKGSSQPLIDTGQMRNSITYVIR